MRLAGSLLAAGALVVAAACGSDADSGPRTVVELPDAVPGDVIALRAGDTDPPTIEWIDRRAGTIQAAPIDGGEVVTLAEIDVSTDGEQRGLLGHTVIDGVRYVAFTDPDTRHLVVGAVGEPAVGAPGGVARIVWDGGGTAGGAVGGHLAHRDGRLVLGMGQRTDWAREHGSGAMVALDPNGDADQEPDVLSDGYTNPFAFAVVGGIGDPSGDDPSGDDASDVDASGDDPLWVADNAVGDDVERVGRGDLDDRDDHVRSDVEPRAPSAVVVLPDGDLAICGFLDAQLRRWSPDTTSYGDPIGSCLTGAAVLADGTVVTATGTALLALTP